MVVFCFIYGFMFSVSLYKEKAGWKVAYVNTKKTNGLFSSDLRYSFLCPRIDGEKEK